MSVETRQNESKRDNVGHTIKFFLKVPLIQVILPPPKELMPEESLQQQYPQEAPAIQEIYLH